MLDVSCLSLFMVGNTTTSTVFAAFTALSSLGLYSSYIIAISNMLHARLKGRLSEGPGHVVQYGAWKLPRSTGVPMNIKALIWTDYLVNWPPFPNDDPSHWHEQ